MKLFTIVCITLGLATVALASSESRSSSSYEESSEELVQPLTNDATIEAEEQANIAKSEENIRAQNEKFKNGESTFKEKSNNYEYLSKEEFEKEREGLTMPLDIAAGRAFGGLIPENPADRYDEESEQYLARLRLNRATPPSSWDSRTRGWISPVKNQQQCGSCAAFSATALVETCIKKTSGEAMQDLSEQFMVDCGYNGDSMNGCGGAYIHAYQDFISKKHQELPHESSAPYVNTNPTLQCDTSLPLQHGGAKVTGAIFTYSCNEDTLKRMIMEHGAVSTGIYASDSGFTNYASGVFQGCSSSQVNHAVTVVGWNDATDSWLVKNSWGTTWGEKGFFRMKKGHCGVGTVCAGITCTKGGAVSPPVTTTPPPPPPPSQTCNISQLYGSGITGWYNLKTRTNTGNEYISEVKCTNSVCEPRSAGVSNCCVYICGKTSC